MNKKAILYFLIIAFSHFFLIAQQRTVIFYGPISSSNDVATTKLTSDLFYSQFASLPGYSLVDKRNVTFQENFISEITQDNTILFYVEIDEKELNWECTLTVIDSISKQSFSKKDVYDGYYQILMDAKNSLTLLLDDFSKVYNTLPISANPQKTDSSLTLTLENVAGTWKGDFLISKIVILRGGKGFVIFKNGASMNISVSINNSTLIATQTSRANASFFPDLPREIALVAAGNAEPIYWTLSLVDENTLSGKKTTLMPQDNQAVQQSIEVTWTKVQ